MKFEYQAIDLDGGVVRGIIEAHDAKKVLQILLHKQLHPLDIRGLTDSTVELGRLHQLKNKLEGIKVKPESIPEPIEGHTPKMKPKFDWTYTIFLIMMVGFLIAAAFFG